MKIPKRKRPTIRGRNAERFARKVLDNQRKRDKLLNANRYAIWIETKHIDGGYSGRLYGWSMENHEFTYEEALRIKSNIENEHTVVRIEEVK